MNPAQLKRPRADCATAGCPSIVGLTLRPREHTSLTSPSRNLVPAGSLTGVVAETRLVSCCWNDTRWWLDDVVTGCLPWVALRAEQTRPAPVRALRHEHP